MDSRRPDYTTNDIHHNNQANRESQGANNDPFQNVCILLDSDEENDGELHQSSTNKDIDMLSLELEPSIVSRDNNKQPSPRSSPAVQILSSPSPSPTTQRIRQDDEPLLDTNWLSPPTTMHYDIDIRSSPPSPVHYDIDLSSSPHRPVDTTITASTSSLLTSNAKDRYSSPNPFDKDLDTQLILSDNDSVDSLPSSDELFSQMGNTSSISNTKHGSRQFTNTSSQSKGKGKQVASTEPAAKRTFISDRLWEWDDDDDFGESTCLIDQDDSTPRTTHSCNASQDTSSQLSTKEQKKLQRQMEQAAKKRAREEAQRAKEEAKRLKEQEKVLAKQLQQVNKLRKDRDELIKEMTVVVRDRAFMESNHGQVLRGVLLEKDAKIICQPTTVSYTLTWKRDYQADWDDEQQQFIPFANGEIKSKEERAALVFMTAEAFVDMIHQDRVDTWIDGIQQDAAEKQVFLMIEGLELFYKKKMNWRRRQFTSTVMGNLTEENGSSSSSSSGSTTTNVSDDDDVSSANRRPTKRKKTTLSTALMEDGPSRDTIEETLTYLQVIKDVMLIQTLNDEDSVDWLVCLTTDLAKAVYRNTNTAALCKGPRSGADAEDVWSRMLQEIQNCTPAVAKSIADAYPNPMALYQGYTELTSSNARDSLLAHLEVQRSVLSTRDRTVNKFMSAKIHKIFMAEDPTDVIQ